MSATSIVIRDQNNNSIYEVSCTIEPNEVPSIASSFFFIQRKFNKEGKLTELHNSFTHYIKTEYEEQGRIVNEQTKYYDCRFTYPEIFFDEEIRVETCVRSDYKDEVCHYNEKNQLIYKKDFDGIKRYFTYNELGQLIRDEGKFETIIFTYLPDGKVHTKTCLYENVESFIYTYHYNDRGQITNIENKDKALSESFIYDERGNEIFHQHGSYTKTSEYDSLNRLVKKN